MHNLPAHFGFDSSAFIQGHKVIKFMPNILDSFVAFFIAFMDSALLKTVLGYAVLQSRTYSA